MPTSTRHRTTSPRPANHFTDSPRDTPEAPTRAPILRVIPGGLEVQREPHAEPLVPQGLLFDVTICYGTRTTSAIGQSWVYAQTATQLAEKYQAYGITVTVRPHRKRRLLHVVK